MSDGAFRINRGLTLNPQASAPTNPQNGDFYYDSVRNTFVRYSNGVWADVQSRSDVASASDLTSGQFTSSVSQSSFIRVTGSTQSNIHGLAAQADAKMVVVYNASTARLTVKNASTTETTASNRILTSTSSDITINAGESAIFMYDSSQSRWILATVSGSGSGSGTGKNYLAAISTSLGGSTKNTGNGDFEFGTTLGWSLGHVTLSSTKLPTGAPTFGSGASGNLSFLVVSSGQIAGSYSGSYVSSAATVAGDFLASDAFYIDKEDQAQILNVSISYNAASNPTNADWSGTSTSSFGWAIYDVTNSSWIIPAKPFVFTQSSGVGKATGYFQTSYNGTQYRIVLFNANATSGGITLDFDDFFVGPAPVNNVIAPVSLVAIKNAGSVTGGSAVGVWTTIVKDSVGAFNASTGIYTVQQAGDYYVNFSFATTATGNNSGQIAVNGTVLRKNDSNAANGYHNVSGLLPGLNPGDQITVETTSNATFTSDQTQNVLSIHQVQSAGTGPAGQVVAAMYGVSSATSQTANTPVNYDNKIFTAGPASITTGAGAWRFTAPITGIYEVAHSGYGGSANFDFNLYKNGSLNAHMGTMSSTFTAKAATGVWLNAGEYIDIRCNGTFTPGAAGGGTTATSNYIFICLVQGPSSNQATPSIVVSANNTSGQSLSNNTLTTLTGWTKLKDSQNIFNTSTGIATIQTSGSYRATLQVGAIPTTQNVGVIQASIVQAGSASTSIIGSTPFGSSGNTSTSLASFTFSCVAGDTLTFKALQDNGGAVNLSTNAAFNAISIERVGN